VSVLLRSVCFPVQTAGAGTVKLK